MKKIISLILAVSMCFVLFSCKGVKKEEEAKAQIPFSSTTFKGMDFKKAKENLEQSGFTNIKLEEIKDLGSSQSEKDGRITEIFIGEKSDFSAGASVPSKTKILIKYHSLKENKLSIDMNSPAAPTQAQEETEALEDSLTPENCIELKKILQNKNSHDKQYEYFSKRYRGKIIEFEGRIDYKTSSNKDRFDYLLSYGDYEPDTQSGPTFIMKNIGSDDFFFTIGENVTVKARVNEYDLQHGLFLLDPISVEVRQIEEAS